MSQDELKAVEELYQFLRRWEMTPSSPSSSAIKEFQSNLVKLRISSKIEIRKLADLADKFHAELSPQELFNLTVPFERALSKSLRDDEFLVSSLDSPQKERITYPLVIVLENIRSAFNVGSFFRMAEALGLKEIILTGYTATPDNEKLKKTTMGTESWIPWRSFSTTHEALQHLKSQGYRVIGLETSQKAISLDQAFNTSPTAFVFGNERFGLDLETLRSCDELRQIPLGGQKNSLNVASCGAICSYEWIRQWKNTK